MRGISVRTVFNNLHLVVPAVNKAAGISAHKIAVEVREDIHDAMEAPKHGNTYLIGGKIHQASAPGEAPAVFSGDLIASVKEEQVNATTWDVLPMAKMGSKWGIRMNGPASARPFLRPAATRPAAKFGNAVRLQ
jgi:hypothetical protein